MHRCIPGHTDLRLSFVEHVGGGFFQVLLLRLRRVIDVDRVGGILTQVHTVDGASFSFQLTTQQQQCLISYLLSHINVWLQLCLHLELDSVQTSIMRHISILMTFHEAEELRRSSNRAQTYAEMGHLTSSTEAAEIFLNFSQACQNKMFSALTSEFKKAYRGR